MGITMAEYIRQLVDRDLGPNGNFTDPSAIFGIGRSGGSDIAQEGKQAIAAAIAEYGSGL